MAKSTKSVWGAWVARNKPLAVSLAALVGGFLAGTAWVVSFVADIKDISDKGGAPAQVTAPTGNSRFRPAPSIGDGTGATGLPQDQGTPDALSEKRGEGAQATAGARLAADCVALSAEQKTMLLDLVRQGRATPEQVVALADALGCQVADKARAAALKGDPALAYAHPPPVDRLAGHALLADVYAKEVSGQVATLAESDNPKVREVLTKVVERGFTSKTVAAFAPYDDDGSCRLVDSGGSGGRGAMFVCGGVSYPKPPSENETKALAGLRDTLLDIETIPAHRLGPRPMRR